MIIRIVIPGQLPGLNEYIAAERSSKYKAAKMKHEAERLISYYANLAAKGDKVAAPVMIHYTWIEPNKRRDKDNIAWAKKFLQDALVAVGILADDGWKHIEGFTDSFAVDKHNPRIKIEIKEIN